MWEWGRSISVEFWYKSKVKLPKIDNYKMFYKNLTITTKKKPLVYMQKKKSKESKYTAHKKSQPATKVYCKRER